ncbi:MAG TPA: hypothetical protein GXZ28_05830 [Clostridiales bacterium]|jgi:hypothetical protein|nr:hypothetical protein [Clostridiales bacterium]
MRELNYLKVFVQYRDEIKPYEPLIGRKYTIVHSDITGDLFVIISNNFADDLITRLRDEVNIAWEINETGFALIGSVIVDGEEEAGDADIRNKIFYNEMPTVLQALREADRFFFDKDSKLDDTPVYIQFVSSVPEYHKTHYFGEIGDYRIRSKM